MIPPLLTALLLILLSGLGFWSFRDMRRAVPADPDSPEPEPRWLALLAQAAALGLGFLCILILAFGYTHR